MHTDRERLWIDLSGIFCKGIIYSVIAAKNINTYCTYNIEEIKYIFFHEVAPVCKKYKYSYNHYFDDELLIRDINKMLNSTMYRIYNNIFYYKLLHKIYTIHWKMLEFELIETNYLKIKEYNEREKSKSRIQVMYTQRERLWVDLSDIFCDDEKYFMELAKKINTYCIYSIEEIKYIFFYEVAPICKQSEGNFDYGFGFDEEILIKNINKMFNSMIYMLYNNLFYYKYLQKACKAKWEKFEKELIKINYHEKK
jgi:hypothetical protein